MRKVSTTPAGLLRQFKSHSRKVNALLKTGEFNALPGQVRSRMLYRLRSLYAALEGRFGKRRLQRVLAGAALLLGLSSQVVAQAPNFTGPTTNPFGLTSGGAYFIQPEAADMDDDGDLDLFIGDDYGSFQLYENTGTATAPAFAAPAAMAFGLDSVTGYYGYLALADMDADGDLDAFVGDVYQGVFYYVNNGTAAAASFDGPFTDTLGITTTPVRQIIPELVDLDNDGDFDLLISNYDAQMIYHENTGTATDAMFAPGDTLPFNMAAPNSYALPTFADIDGDGDQDLLYNTYMGEWIVQENVGTMNMPSFGMANSNPFGLSNGGGFNQPMLADFDGDSDFDLLYSGAAWEFNYYENGPAVSVQSQLDAMEISVSPNPAQDFVKLSISGGQLADEVNIEVFTVMGKQVMQMNVATNGGDLDQVLPVNELAPGNYMIRIRSGEAMLHERFTRQ